MPQSKVPLWVMEQTFGAYGARGPQYPAILDKDADECGTCHKVLPTFRERNWWYQDKKNYCDECIKPKRASTASRYTHNIWNGYQDDYMDPEETKIQELRKSIKEVPVGNLPEQDYRFWIGKEYQTNPVAICRACGEEANSDVARLAHKSKETEFRDGTSCTVVLRKCYDRLLAKGKCVVCGMHCFGMKRYGIPMCGADCLVRWKFDNKEWVGLAMEIAQEWKPSNEKV
jgi:hypothetical protein